ncbi:rod shape-determining protein MreC [Lachnotalea glycerini]|uniref:Cell shape-determining protein MreC n=1 Tax=Lachnotalea glycerini TaxID=1763509 RepID=A0A255I4W1_9FIRM|nr:rod shape-determining protein MreC [Lachnotalea glycerini]PXV95528.1 rod shape-determining protein MreC [Lachnotalea glycerini]RDY32846.1 rod shape-determining protein MreC [Lachnotalea glycerini]
MKRKARFSLPSKYLLLIVTFFCVAMIFITFTTDLATGPFKVISGYVFIPIQNGINYIGTSLTGKAEQLQNLQDLMDKNIKLQAMVDELTIENSALQQDKYELARLRELYKLDETYPSYNKVAARIIGKDPGNWFSTFTIDKGSNEGFKVDNNVIAGSGLVGIITEVGPNWSTVRAIIDDSSNVSAMILSTSDRCIITGDLKLMSQGMIQFSQLNDQDNLVNVGDKVVTSNISDKYLQGILIGYISEKTTDANNLTSSGYVTPVVDFEHLQEVLVITDLKE